MRPIWSRIHRANMEKFGPGGYKRERDGKWMKPPNFHHPDDDIRREIANQREAQRLEKERTQYVQCPCGGGQSCIVDRRHCGDWVHEDDVLRAAGLPLRKNCWQGFSKEQTAAMKAATQGYDSVCRTTQN